MTSMSARCLFSLSIGGTRRIPWLSRYEPVDPRSHFLGAVDIAEILESVGQSLEEVGGR
jgi:hypothetical protein